MSLLASVGSLDLYSSSLSGFRYKLVIRQKPTLLTIHLGLRSINPYAVTKIKSSKRDFEGAYRSVINNAIMSRDQYNVRLIEWFVLYSHPNLKDGLAAYLKFLRHDDENDLSRFLIPEPKQKYPSSP